jgi:hypothetical protein
VPPALLPNATSLCSAAVTTLPYCMSQLGRLQHASWHLLLHVLAAVYDYSGIVQRAVWHGLSRAETAAQASEACAISGGLVHARIQHDSLRAVPRVRETELGLERHGVLLLLRLPSAAAACLLPLPACCRCLPAAAAACCCLPAAVAGAAAEQAGAATAVQICNVVQLKNAMEGLVEYDLARRQEPAGDSSSSARDKQS